MARKKFFHLIILLGVLLFVSCGESVEEERARTRAEQARLAAEERAAFKVAVLPTLDCLPLYLLKDSQLYDTTKIDIRLKRFTAQMDCDTALIGGSVQGAVTDLVRAARLQRQGTVLKYVAATNAYWQLITGKRARLRELSQFSDKMVAMTRYSATDLLTDIALKEAKTKYPAYKVQINDVGVRLHMMLNNEMDAAWFTEPQATAARAAGHFMMKDSRKDSLQLGVLAFRTLDVTQGKRPQELALFLKAYNAACERINRNGVQYYAPLIKKYMDATDQTIGRLPKLSFPIAAEPRQKDVDKAAAL